MAATLENQPQPTPSDELPRWLWIGPILLFLAGCAFGMMERHSSTDTWIAFTAGKYMYETGQVTKVDEWSFTAGDHPWINQNWLSHLFFYSLYRISPNMVAFGTWGVNVLIFTLVMLAARMRSRSWLAALIAGGLVAVGGREFLSARPATIQFLMMAAFWLLLCRLDAPTRSKPLWPAVLMFPLLVIWGCAHGSFLFGYAMLGVYGACWVATRLFLPRLLPSTGRQLVTLIIASVAALLVTVIFGPFGLENFTHPFKVVNSADIWRQVSEWRPPTEAGRHFPPVFTFWMLIYIAFGLLFAAIIAYLFEYMMTPPAPAPVSDKKQQKKARKARIVADRAATEAATEPDDEPAPRIWLFDLAAVSVGLFMVLGARRFAPLFYILATPAYVTLLVLLARGFREELRFWIRVAAPVLAFGGAAAVASLAALNFQKELVAPYKNQPEWNIFERTVVAENLPNDAFHWINENQLPLRVLTEWTAGGAAMFFAPTVRVFIDGRAQQVYSEDLYIQYQQLRSSDTSRPQVLGYLDQYGADSVLLPNATGYIGLIRLLDQSPKWSRVFYNLRFVLFVRIDSDVMRELKQRERAGTLKWDDSIYSLMGQAWLRLQMDPPDYDGAIPRLLTAVRAAPVFGGTLYQQLMTAYRGSGRCEEGLQVLREEAIRMSKPIEGVDERTRLNVLEALNNYSAALSNSLRMGQCLPPKEQ